MDLIRTEHDSVKMHSTNSGQRQVADFCQHGNELSSCIKHRRRTEGRGDFLSRWVGISSSIATLLYGFCGLFKDSFCYLTLNKHRWMVRWIINNELKWMWKGAVIA